MAGNSFRSTCKYLVSTCDPFWWVVEIFADIALHTYMNTFVKRWEVTTYGREAFSSNVNMVVSWLAQRTTTTCSCCNCIRLATNFPLFFSRCVSSRRFLLTDMLGYSTFQSSRRKERWELDTTILVARSSVKKSFFPVGMTFVIMPWTIERPISPAR